MKRWILALVVLFGFLPLAAEAEVVALQLERKGVKKPEQMVYGVDLASGQVVWEHRFGEEVNFVEKVKGGLLVGCDDGTLSLVDPATGSLRWTAKLGEKDEKVNTFRGEFAEGFLVSFHNEVLWLVSPKGELVWVLR
ncbi:MAG: PQQ-binding-like beta-propeller repeat protein [Acidobacteriota bacterium]